MILCHVIFLGKPRKLNDGTLNKLMTALYGIVHLHNSNLVPPPEPEQKPIGAASRALLNEPSTGEAAQATTTRGGK